MHRECKLPRKEARLVRGCSCIELRRTTFGRIRHCVIFQIFHLVASGEAALQRDMKETVKVELGVLMVKIQRLAR